MKDLNDRFRSLDRVWPRDLWSEADQRARSTSLPQGRERRPLVVIAAAAAAVFLVIGGTALLVRSDLGEAPQPAVSPVGAGESTALPATTTTTEAVTTTEAAPTTTEAPPTTAAAVVSTGVEVYEVTIELLGDEGLATTCGPLIMRPGGDGLLPASALVADGTGGSSVPRLFLKVSEELSWQRGFPEPLSGDGFGVSPSNEECHGGTVEGSPSPWDGLLFFDTREALDWADDTTIEFLWHFDYYNADWSNGIIENFTIRGLLIPVEWTELPDGGRTTEVNGKFNVTWFQLVDGENVHLYEPFAGSPRTLHFRLTVSPPLDSIALEEPVELDEIDAAASERAAEWDTVATELGAENLTLKNGTSMSWTDTNDSGVDTIWELSTETASARVKHTTGSIAAEMLFLLDSGYDTEAGQAWLHDATLVMIRVWEPTLSDLEMEDLATRLLAPEEFGYEEVGSTVFMSDATSDTERYLLATPMAMG